MKSSKKRLLGSASYYVEVITSERAFKDTIKGTLLLYSGRSMEKEAKFDNFNELAHECALFWQEKTGNLPVKRRLAFWFEELFQDLAIVAADVNRLLPMISEAIQELPTLNPVEEAEQSKVAPTSAREVRLQPKGSVSSKYTTRELIELDAEERAKESEERNNNNNDD
ncbi:MAG: hypothetical protein KAR35_11040 [Candidatus Heimdallarchaeota archaeon]|nr:hypothetical protein [Candidatus Heimdallarchaeota archaeon]MCK5049895.1 hypothetical protein [Candidatus Heimdallarchaeota archaeon]